MPNRRTPTVLRTDASGLANFTGEALLVLEISKHEIEAGMIASVLERLHVIAESKETALRYRESLVIQVLGYDDDPRELAEIAEVRAFFARLTEEWPHWLWFLHRRVGAIHLLMALLCAVKIHRRGSATGTEFLNGKELADKMTDLLRRGNAMFHAFGISHIEAQASTESACADLVPS
ncbi:MAG: DUF1817 domain-containing protein [Hyphomicrobiales bacterium]|nr:MAG: DUF1817 domain-containing protein [Hyphomicrobiales bacterium]